MVKTKRIFERNFRIQRILRMAIEEVKIPQERVAVLVGTKGSMRRKIEKISSTKLIVDSANGDVKIEGEDSLKVFTTRDVVKAIGRGFNPLKALKLLEEDNVFELVSIKEYAGKSQKKEERLKSRIIGTEGKAKKTIEDKTYCELSIYGKTVGVIGPINKVHIARRAVEMILHGSQHGHVYQWIDDQLEKEKLDDFSQEIQ